MAVTPMNKESNWLTQTLGRTDIAARTLQLVLALAGTLGSLEIEWRKSPMLVAMSAMGLLLAITWFAIGAYLRRRRPKATGVTLVPRSTSSYLRSLLPFEEGDRLLGRDQEVGQLLALMRSLEYRCGFLSGEAGAGKTSLLRARILPELKKEGRHVVYVPRAGSDPCAAIQHELRLSVTLKQPPVENVAFRELLRDVMEAISGKTLVLIIDQFEEYFVAMRAPGKQDAFEEALADLLTFDHRLRVLFSLRKEFVDDLLDLGRAILPLQNSRWRLPLRSFAPGTARDLLRKVSQEENLPFSDELQDMVIVDLTRAQRVRPVEFQIVLTTLLIQGVSELSAYRSMEGAQGVIARFVSNSVEPPDLKVNEVERAVARQTLRALCNKEFTTRRPIGLTRTELLERILAEMKINNGIPVVRDQAEKALNSVLQRFLENYILIPEDKERFNLVHDYLASPVRDATTGMETVEERADRLLDQYIEQARADHHVVMPWKTLRFVERFAGGENLARSDASALLRRTRLQHNVLAIGVVLALLTLITLLLPFGVRYPIQERLELVGERSISSDGRLLLAVDKNQATVIRLDRLNFELRKLSLPMKQLFPAPDGETLLGIGTDGALYRAHIDSDLKLDKLIDNVGWDKLGRRNWAGFSSDGSWSFAVSTDGTVYVWPTNGRPRKIHKIIMSDMYGRPIDQTKPLPSEIDWANRAIAPEIGFTADDGWLWIIDDNGHFFLLDPRRQYSSPPTALTTLSGHSDDSGNVKSSEDGTWLAVADSNRVQVIRLTTNGASAPVTALKVSAELPSRPSLWFSPHSKWLVMRPSFQNFYALDLREPIVAASFAAIDLPATSFDLGNSTVVFNDADQYAAGQAQNGLIYIWKLASPPRADALPAVGNLDKFNDGQSAFFCANSGQVLVGATDGSIYSAQLKDLPVKMSQIGRLARPPVQFRMASDQQTVFAYDSVRLATGTCDDLHIILEHDSNIIRIVTGQEKSLVLVAERDLVRLGRSFYMWGIPVWQIGWPGIMPAFKRHK